MRRVTLLAAALAITAVGPGCGDDDGGAPAGDDSASAREQEYIDALVESGQAEPSQFTAAELECLSRSLVEVIGVDRLEDAVSPEEVRNEASGRGLSDLGISLDEAEGDALWEAVNACAEIRETLREGIVAQLPADARPCVRVAMDDELLKRLFLASVAHGDDAVDNDEPLRRDIVEALRGCQ